MTTVTLKGNAIETSGNLPAVGTKAPDFKLVATDLSTKSLSDFAGNKVVLNIFPSIDTGTCAASVRQFNQEASELDNTKVLCISRDLPFAHARFCGAEGLDNVISLSDFKRGRFGKKYGLKPSEWSSVKLIGTTTFGKNVGSITFYDGGFSFYSSP